MTTTVPKKPPRPGYPDSPCIDICTLDARNVCVGCKRTLQEIIDWSAMSADEQWHVVRQLGERNA